MSEASNGAVSEYFLNEFVSLPMVIKHHNSGLCMSASSFTLNNESILIIAAAAAHVLNTPHEWASNALQSSDDILYRAAAGLKQRLRDACIEVLRRTEEVKRGETQGACVDDHARFLD